MTANKKPLKLHHLHVENFKKLVIIDVKLNEHVTEITGKNGAGKTSILDAIRLLFEGKSVAPVKPIRDGQNSFVIRGRLGELVITREGKRNKKNEVTYALSIVRGDEAFPNTETQLRDLIGQELLDPMDFLDLDDKGRFNILKTFVPEVDFDLLARQHKADFDRRRDLNRFADQERAAAALITFPENTPDTLVDEAALLEQFTQASQANAELEARKARRQRAADEIEELKTAVESHSKTVNDAIQKCAADRDIELADIDATIAALEKRRESRIEFYQARTVEIMDDSAKVFSEKSDRIAQLQEKLQSAEPLPKPADLDAMREGLRQAQITNRNVTQRQTRDKHETAAQAYEAQADALTDSMEKREKAKQKAISAAKFPVPELSFTADNDILLNKQPWEQASMGQKLRVAVALNVAKNPVLRILWLQNASLLDDEAVELVKKYAQEYDCQVLLETVKSAGQDVIRIEDGRIAKAEAPTGTD